jgi:lysozyme family protein
MIAFDTAIERVLGHEGGYVNDPADPGGETHWGICRRSYPTLDIKNLTRDGAKALYEHDFWNPVASNVNDSALVFQMLDAAINHGMDNATRFLQRALDVADDGHFGPASTAALKRADIKDVHLLFMAERFEFWAKLNKFDNFGRGWVRRGAKQLRYIAQDN